MLRCFSLSWWLKFSYWNCPWFWLCSTAFIFTTQTNKHLYTLRQARMLSFRHGPKIQVLRCDIDKRLFTLISHIVLFAIRLSEVCHYGLCLGHLHRSTSVLDLNMMLDVNAHFRGQSKSTLLIRMCVKWKRTGTGWDKIQGCGDHTSLSMTVLETTMTKLLVCFWHWSVNITSCLSIWVA